MKETAKLIREGIKKAGFRHGSVSVRCMGSYMIDVRIRNEGVNKEVIKNICEKAYKEKDHSWLLVKLDGIYL